MCGASLTRRTASSCSTWDATPFAGASAELRQSDRIRRLYLGEDARLTMGEEILEFLILGLVLVASTRAFAVGLTLIFGVLDIINVAHSE